MEAPHGIIRRQTRQSKRCLIISIIVVVIGILAILIPVAVFTRKHPNILTPTILVPLYIYPDPGAWEPLFDALAAHPRLSFVVIINIDTGPGSTQYPSIEYITQIQRLNTYPNVQTVGYVHTGWTGRSIHSVLQDVSTYSGWAAYNDTSLAMHGIFFDETARNYTAANNDYLKTINEAVKTAIGLQSNRLVIHNPGTVPDAGFDNSNTDVTVVFEDSYSQFQEQQATLAALPENRSRYSYLIHSVPSNVETEGFLQSLSQQAQFLFLTTLTQKYYESFAPQWKEFTDAAAT